MNDKLNDVKNNVLDKADTLCSKLPLDKINQKLGGKLDVNSKKVRLLFGAGILAVIVVIVVVLISLFSSPSLTEAELAKAKIDAANIEISNITGITYVESATAIHGAKALIFNAEGFDQDEGKIVPIHIVVIRDLGVVDVCTGHYSPGDWNRNK